MLIVSHRSRSLAAAAVAASLLLSPAPAIAQDGSVPPLAKQPGSAQCRGADGYSEDFGGRRTFLWRPAWLQSVAGRARSDAQYRASIVAEAEAALKRGPYSVTDKPSPPPGASASDYASIGPYWWPNPKSENGLPYVRRDGQVNPERDGPEFDKSRLRALGADTKALALAYFVTEDERFADHAARNLRTWFVDPATRMNPNLDFAQGIPGKVDGRGEGIIEASDLATIVEAIGLLRPSDSLTAQDHAAIEGWYRDFAHWMATSDNGASEMRKINNHAVFFDFFLSQFALFARMESVAGNIVDAFPRQRLGVQMDRRGRFIEELKRTRSWHYSHFVVEAAAKLATIGECVDRDLWSARLDDGRSLATARAFLASYAHRPGEWPFEDRELAAGKIDQMQARSRMIAQLFERGAKSSGSADQIVIP